VLWKIFSLLRSFKPLTFFGAIGLLLFLLALLAGAFPLPFYFPPPRPYIHHLPLAIFTAAPVLFSCCFFFFGLLLHSLLLLVLLFWEYYSMHSIGVFGNCITCSLADNNPLVNAFAIAGNVLAVKKRHLGRGI